MAQRIQRFGIVQTAKVFGVLYGLMGVVLLPLFALMAVFGHSSENPFGLGFALTLPLLYGGFGFVFVAIGCWLYNMVASWVGGIEVELEVDGATR